jgi:RNA polymerase sigma factor (sigma-70 family)
MERNLKATCTGLRQTLGRDPLDNDADAMGLTKAAYTRACRTVERAENSGFVAFEEAFGDDQRALARAIGYVEDGPDVELERTELRMQLVAAMGKLHERERKVLALYYEEEMTMAEIARVLGLSESRISQLRSLALSRLRTVRAARNRRSTPVTARKPAPRRCQRPPSGGASGHRHPRGAGRVVHVVGGGSLQEPPRPPVKRWRTPMARIVGPLVIALVVYVSATGRGKTRRPPQADDRRSPEF